MVRTHLGALGLSLLLGAWVLEGCGGGGGGEGTGAPTPTGVVPGERMGSVHVGDTYAAIRQAAGEPQLVSSTASTATFVWSFASGRDAEFRALWANDAWGLFNDDDTDGTLDAGDHCIAAGTGKAGVSYAAGGSGTQGWATQVIGKFLESTLLGVGVGTPRATVVGLLGPPNSIGGGFDHYDALGIAFGYNSSGKVYYVEVYAPSGAASH